MKTLVLASTSPYRKALLDRLQVPFIIDAPNIDEMALSQEPPETLVKRLALQKAQAVAVRHPCAVIIGSDQVALLDGTIIGKPITHKNACEQLLRASGKTLTFLTGLCVLDSASQHYELIVEPFEVAFRQLTPTQIDNYLYKERPYDCAGSFKSEGLGITLFTSLNGNDPTSLVGLPLIQLTTLLIQMGILL
jgi:septum formation protein